MHFYLVSCIPYWADLRGFLNHSLLTSTNTYNSMLLSLSIYANPSIFLPYKCRFSTDIVKKESIDVNDFLNDWILSCFISKTSDVQFCQSVLDGRYYYLKYFC